MRGFSRSQARSFTSLRSVQDGKRRARIFRNPYEKAEPATYASARTVFYSSYSLLCPQLQLSVPNCREISQNEEMHMAGRIQMDGSFGKSGLRCGDLAHEAEAVVVVDHVAEGRAHAGVGTAQPRGVAE